MFWVWFVRTFEPFIIIYVRTVSERPLNCGVVVAGRNPFYRDLTFVCAFIAGSSSRRQKLLENPLNLNSLNSSCSKAGGHICQLTRRLCRNGLRVWHAIWVAEQGDWVVVKSLAMYSQAFSSCIVCHFSWLQFSQAFTYLNQTSKWRFVF